MQSELENLRHRAAELEKECAQLKTSLDETEDRFRKIFHSSSNLMSITTLKEGRIIDINEAGINFGGYEREEIIGHVANDLDVTMDPQKDEWINRLLREEGSIHGIELDVRTKNGDIQTILLSADPITVNNEPCLLNVSVDITAREKEAEALRKSEEKYRLLVENSLQGLLIIQDVRIVFCNSAFAAISGYSVEELLALPHIRPLIHPDDRDLVLGRYAERMAGQPTPQHYEYRLVRKDGTVRWLEMFASLSEYNGEIASQSVHMDITDRKQAENALRESEERFRLIADTIDEIFWIFDTAKGVATYLSPAFDRIWGISRESVANNPNYSLEAVHHEDWKKLQASAELMKQGQPLELEFRITRPDGSVRHLWQRGFPVINKTGDATRYVGMSQDITMRRQAEEALKESREYLNQIINCIGDPIFVKDSDHKFVLVNDAFCSFFGSRPEAFLGKMRLESMPDEQLNQIIQEEKDVFRSGKEQISEDNLPDSHSTPHIILTKKSLLTDKDGNKQIVAVQRDITGYKQLEAQFLQAQKMEAIGILAGGVAHDFNNLLNVINGYSELILDALAQENPIRKDIEQIKEAGKRAAGLTSQLLAFGRKQILQPEIVNLNTVISHMSSMLRRLIGEDIELNTITHEDLGLINADPGQIQQIVMNLAVNARDAMPQGGTLTIEASDVYLDQDYVQHHPMIKAGPHVLLAISDNGIGMDEATQSHLFEPFFTTKKKGKGTGLGLSTVYGIVRQSNGFIWVSSEPGKGSTFKIYFPHAEGRIASHAEGAKTDASLRGSETVLVAEDEIAVRSLVRRILCDCGYNILEAKDGTEALARAQEHKGEIQLVLTDVVMPGLGGTALVARLKAVRPNLKALYISGYTDNAIVHHGILDSNVAFLQKPFTVESLIRKVRDVLNS